MTMTTNESVDTLSPFAGPVSPILFGIEHEYNVPFDPEDYCDCYECYDGEYDECEGGRGEFSMPELPDGWDQHEEHCGWEVKTPPMTDIGEAMDVFRRLNSHFTWGNENCGYHIHLNADPENGPAVNVVKFAQNWLAHRDTLRRHCPSPYGGVGIDEDDREQFAAAMDDDVQLWLDTGPRYCEVNHGAISSHTTIEVRLGAATAEIDHFETWLRYVIAVGNMSLLSDDPIADYTGYVTRNAYGYYNAVGRHLTRLGVSQATILTMSEAFTGAA